MSLRQSSLHRSYAPVSSGLTKGGLVCSYVPASVWIQVPDACYVNGRAQASSMVEEEVPSSSPVRPGRVR